MNQQNQFSWLVLNRTFNADKVLIRNTDTFKTKERHNNKKYEKKTVKNMYS